jgi:ABC-type nickel/cobalt efflux system permease component RcnA
MTFESFSNALLQWIIRGAGLLWLVGAFALFRQIRAEMALDRLTSDLAKIADELDAELSPDAPPGHHQKSQAERAEDKWIDRDDAARRGWIAAQAVVLAATALAMLMLHPFASWMVALLVLGQGVYFFWREHTARHAPLPTAAEHARPTQSTINAGWVSLALAVLVWAAAWRGLLA